MITNINILHWNIVVIKIMKKISWISSYPKSGNTYLRLLLSAYFYSDEGIVSDFSLIDNIFKISNYNFIQNNENVPNIEEFISNPILVSKYWSIVQQNLSNKIKKNLFIKTHDCMANILDKNFTNSNFTRCFLYIVRDPRSVAVSYSHHTGYDISTTINFLINKNYIINYKKEEMTLPEIISSWSVHYNSWKNFLNEGNGKIIKYEDLVKNPKKEFKAILIFLQNFLNFYLNEKKIDNCVKSTKLIKLKKLEEKIGFKEKSINNKNFFRKGIVDEWQQVLSKKQIKIIENSFKKEMFELQYI